MAGGLLDIAVQLLDSGNNLNYLKDRYTTTELIGLPVPIWVNTSDKWVLFNEIPELKAVIRRYAGMIASGRPELLDLNGDPVEGSTHWIAKLLDHPNALQSWQDMVFMSAINKCVTGNVLIYSPRGSMGNVQQLLPLAFNNVQIVPTGKTLKQTTLDGLIKEFKIPSRYNSSFETFEPREVIYMSEIDGVNLFDVKSRVDSLKYPLSNLAAGYRKRNVLLNNLFTLGVLTGRANNDGISAIPIDADDIAEVREDMKLRHEGEVVITDKDFKFEPMTFPVKDLMLFEEMTEDKLAIIDMYGLNENMFSRGTTVSGSTFNNVELGERQAYNSTIIPDCRNMYRHLTDQLGLKSEGLQLVPSFEHISVLKADETKNAEAFFKRAQAVEKIRNMITISDDEARDMLGI